MTSPAVDSAETKRPLATPEGRARNEEVFRAAAKLMVQKGYGGTSISDIAKAVGLTKAGLYHHITSKQDMLRRDSTTTSPASRTCSFRS